MNYFRVVRNWFGKRDLHKLSSAKRSKAVHNFGNARSVALVYREKGEGFFILVKQYVQVLKAEYGIKEVLALCYIDNKKPVPHYHAHRLKYDYFTAAKLDWKLKPSCEEVDRFTEKQFDILIDLEKDPCIPMLYVVAMSKATFKVGYYSEEWKSLYDMMLKTSGQTTFDGYIDQINHYLNLINTVHARA